MDDPKVVFMHGFTQEEMSRIIRGVKSVVEDPGGVAFCMSTQNNLEWKVKELIKDVVEEHEYMKKNPPGGPKQPGDESAGDESTAEDLGE